jgi:Tol biopolymer transport system component
MALSPLLDRVVFERHTEAAMEDAGAEAASGDAEFQAMADAAVSRDARNVAEGARDLGRAFESYQKKQKRRAAKGGARVPEAEVFAADLDRGEPVRLAAAGEAAFPSWTPGGDRILFAANGASGIEFWTMREDGGDRQPLLKGVKAVDPASVRLSADGKQVFFVAPAEGAPGGDLHVAPAGGGEARRLANKHTFKQRYAVSPDGKRIAYEVPQDVKMLTGEGRSEIWLLKR